MAPPRFHLTPEAAQDLQAAEFAEKDGPTRARMQSVRLYGLGFSVAPIQTATGISRSRLFECCRAYRERGIDALIDQRRGGNNRKLTPEQVADLREQLHRYTPRSLFGPAAATPTGQFWTVTDLARAIEHWYGVRDESLTSYRSLFGRCGFSFQRPDQVFKARREADVLDWADYAENN